MALTGVMGYLLIDQAPQPYNSLKWVIAGASLVAAIGFLAGGRLPKALAAVVTVVALMGGAVGPAVYSLQTAATPHQGSIVTAGPVSGGGMAGTGESAVSSRIAMLLRENASAYTWVAASNRIAVRRALSAGQPVAGDGDRRFHRQ